MKGFAVSHVTQARELLAGGCVKKTSEADNGALKLEIDVSGIQFKQKNNAIAGPNASWGWTWAYTQDGEYHPESRELVQAIEQYGAVEIDGKQYLIQEKFLKFRRLRR